MSGSPSGAVAWDYKVGPDGNEFVDCCWQDWFEEPASEMQSSDEPVDVFNPGDGLCVTQDIDDS